MTDRRRVTITSLIPRVEAIRQQDCQGIVGRLRRDLGLESTSHGQHRPACHNPQQSIDELSTLKRIVTSD
jgi:hypothetical protein